MRSRRSSRPSWSSSAFTLPAAVSLRTTPVASGACVSCTVMFSSSQIPSPAAVVVEAGNTAAAELLPTVRRAHASAESLDRTHVDLPVVKLHLPGRKSTAETPPDPSADLADDLVRTNGKGRPPPRRSEPQGRRPGPPPPPPTTRKEAYRRMRETQAAGRSTARSAAAAGNEAYLPRRDQGPVKKLVRDVVDARRNVGSLFLVVAGVAVVGTIAPN